MARSVAGLRGDGPGSEDPGPFSLHPSPVSWPGAYFEGSSPSRVTLNWGATRSITGAGAVHFFVLLS